MADEIERVLASNEELSRRQEDKIRDATQRLGELQMQVSQLQRVSAMGFLAANLAHDLGTPLHSIAGMANLLLERQGLPQEDRRKLELIVQQAERLSEVIRNVRRATRLPEPRPESMTAGQLFEETLPLVEPLLRNFGIRLKTDIAWDCPTFFADRHRIQTALLNLMQNAIEAIKGDGEISVAAGPSQDHASIVISIGDTGVGISAEVLTRVCEPFFSTHGDDPLRGLGLAIVQDVVKIHGGRMEIESEAGKGTSVKLYFPVAAIASEASLASP
jgi:signal transduction histidine kinase